MQSISTIDLLLTRRSVSPKDMQGEGPSAEQIDTLLRAAHRVPDHGKLGPWRFVVFTDEARRDFGRRLGEIYQADFPSVTADLKTVQEHLFLRAPVIIAVISTAGPHVKIPEWEQVLSAGAACQNILVASHALGFKACWLTEWYSYHPQVKALLGLEPSHNIAGFIYIGNYPGTPEDRVRPPLADRVSYWPI
ncbi:MAG TPA: nitroreductase [Cellvibrionaceae bacterium]|nr:nitroreductase [Cellvibrionaceae bacterium]HMW72201.1 nitroreductase [Cellvibrionaceae bacterium]HNG60325.1 nitroreductase [Cellvibrionaceae bacterium]